MDREQQHDLITRGLARLYRGRLIPVMKGGSDEDEAPLYPVVPEDLSGLTVEELQGIASSISDTVAAVAADAPAYVSEERTLAQLFDETSAAVDSLELVRAELASREPAPEEPTEEAVAARLAELATRARDSEESPEEPEDPAPEEPEDPVEEAAAEAVTAAVEIAVPARPPARAPRAIPQESERPRVALTAAAGGFGLDIGQPFQNEIALAQVMERRRSQFGRIPDGTVGEKVTVAMADWKDEYPAERRLGEDMVENMTLVASALNPKAIKDEMKRRRNGSLVASGGLCAPVTPYYDLQVLSTADRPVRGALPAFSADRGGIRYARPAALSAITTTGVDLRTAAQDYAGGTEGAKSCQTVTCPPFSETDVQIIYHCLQFGNLGARTFPERVAQWNALVLAAHARLAETQLLTGIDAASTAITAGNLGLGASAALLGQILAAVNAIRNRHRMDPEAVLRILLPDWSIDLLISDVIRGQFQRFDTDEDRLTALLRSFDVEPTFYIDGANGASQVFGTQSAGALLPFPSTIRWYLFPEGSFLYLDGGTLELGLVRDSVLNKSNDFQIFGETFENVAFVGIESYAVTSTLCDTGAVSNPATVASCTY